MLLVIPIKKLVNNNRIKNCKVFQVLLIKTFDKSILRFDIMEIRVSNFVLIGLQLL